MRDQWYNWIVNRTAAIENRLRLRAANVQGVARCGVFTISGSRLTISAHMKTMHTFATHKGLVLPGTALVPSGFPGDRIVAVARIA
jgi:hypothetical protein